MCYSDYICHLRSKGGDALDDAGMSIIKIGLQTGVRAIEDDIKQASAWTICCNEAWVIALIWVHAFKVLYNIRSTHNTKDARSS